MVCRFAWSSLPIVKAAVRDEFEWNSASRKSVLQGQQDIRKAGACMRACLSGCPPARRWQRGFPIRPMRPIHQRCVKILRLVTQRHAPTLRAVPACLAPAVWCRQQAPCRPTAASGLGGGTDRWLCHPRRRAVHPHPVAVQPHPALTGLAAVTTPGACVGSETGQSTQSTSQTASLPRDQQRDDWPPCCTRHLCLVLRVCSAGASSHGIKCLHTRHHIIHVALHALQGGCNAQSNSSSECVR